MTLELTVSGSPRAPFPGNLSVARFSQPRRIFPPETLKNTVSGRLLPSLLGWLVTLLPGLLLEVFI
jgi:hypothetical protein